MAECKPPTYTYLLWTCSSCGLLNMERDEAEWPIRCAICRVPKTEQGLRIVNVPRG